jgi:hypothetical protein
LRSADRNHADSWRCDAITWDASKPESFQGLHNVGKRMVFVFDESSDIDPAIWEAQEGSLTDVDTEIIWLCLGNPTRATGRFRQCFPGGRHAGSWQAFAIDTRTARMANKTQIEEWIRVYGLDHDFVRVCVLSKFPNASSTQFIPSEWLPMGAIDDDPTLKADLTAVEYGYKLKDGRDAILLERKKDMKARASHRSTTVRRSR